MLPAVVLLAAALVHQPNPAHAGDSERASRFETKGKKAYVKKRWDDAIAAFDAAYRADARPKYLFNIAKAYEQKGDLDRAVEYCERYVAEAKEQADKTDGQDLLTMLRIKQEHASKDKEEDDKVAAAAAAAVAPPPPPPPPPAPVQTPPPPPPEPEPKKPVIGTPPPADMVKAAQEREPPPPKEIEGKGGGLPDGVMYVYVGAGALFVGGLLVGALARAAQNDRDALQGTDEPVQLSEINEKDSTAQDRAKVANALYLVSFLAAGAGAVWHVTNTSATVTPTLGGAMLTVPLP